MPERGREGRRFRWRLWLRAIHRDLGYFCVGLTFVYALSGLAVNHIADWEPNFRQINRQLQLPLPLPDSDQQLAELAARSLAVQAPVRESYRTDEQTLQVVFDRSTLSIDRRSGRVSEDAQEPRFFLRAANWLHLNRGKKAWTYIADAYATGLLVLSLTGLWMFPGRKGLLGRAGLIAMAGALVPALYVTLSGGP
ncbi:MAG TPA: PepSY-associated TM helix domain-containing protein [Polyangiaceae bacterium]|nr:PepSY-associated TM helix domain-containing protein [Polyangiaceae bacterium]